MRKISALLFGIAVCVSCKTDPDVSVPPTGGEGGNTTLRFDVADINIPRSPESSPRTSFGENFALQWEDESDELGVFIYGTSSTTNAKGTLSRDAESTAYVSATVSSYQTGDQMVAYYPYDAEQSSSSHTSLTLNIPANQTQEALGLFEGSYNPLVSVPVTLDASSTDVAETVLFRSLGAIVEWGVYSTDAGYRNEKIVSVKFTATDDVAGNFTYDLTGTDDTEEPTAGTPTEADQTVTVTLSTPASVPAEATPDNSVYAVMIPGSYTGTLVVTTDRATYTWSDQTLDVQRSYVRRIGLNLASENAVRDGEPKLVDLSANGTANTYIVNEPGVLYAFNAQVKGNGVARSFTWNETDGTEITRGYTDAELVINPAQVALVWYNTPKQADGWSKACPILESSLNLENGTISFLTPTPFVSGNVLIAAYDESGTILWSWNIWASEGYNPEQSVVMAGDYDMMDRNLGAMAGPEVMNSSDIREAAWAVGNYYQWGRKDPFPAPAEYDDTGLEGTNGTSDMYWGLPTYTPIAELAQDYSSKPWGASNMMFGSNAADNCRPLQTSLGTGFSADRSVPEAVAYPYRWMSYTGSDCNWNEYMWMVDYRNVTSAEDKGSWRYLWGAPEIDEIIDNDNQKTIYDPCPVGWKVAPAEAYSKVLSNLQRMTWGFYNANNGAYFPFTGQRQAGFGGSQIRSLTNGTMYLSSACVGETSPQKGYESGVQTYNSYIGAGYNLRCVKENRIDRPASGPRCVMIGNSITRTWNSYHPDFFTDNNFLAKGIDGQTSEQIKSRFSTDVIANDPVCVHIACGINDMANNDGANRTNEGIFNNIKEMAEMAAAKGIKVIIGSTPPANYIWWLDEEWNAANDVAQRVIDLNVMLKAYAEERGFPYVDYHSVLKDEENGLKKEYQVDAVHPNLEGFYVMESVLLPVIEELLYNPNAVNGDGQLSDFENEYWN